jgi:hypothetical protein
MERVARYWEGLRRLEQWLEAHWAVLGRRIRMRIRITELGVRRQKAGLE